MLQNEPSESELYNDPPPSSLGFLVVLDFYLFVFSSFESVKNTVFILKGLATTSSLESISLAHCPIGDGGLESKLRIKNVSIYFFLIVFK